MKTRLIGVLFCVLGTVAYGSTISGVSTGGGTTYTINVTQFSVIGNDMAGLQVHVDFGSGSADCVYATGSPNAGCTVANNFSLTFPALQDTDPDTSGANGIWTLTNLRPAGVAGNNITDLVLNGIAGGVIFDRCLLKGNVFDDTNNNISVCDTAHNGIEGTLGTAEGWSVNNANGGTSGITGAGTYSNALHTSGQAPVLDAWGTLTLVFGGSDFAPGSNFTFRADTDLATATADVPEPATFALLGLGLAGMGLFRIRKRS